MTPAELMTEGRVRVRVSVHVVQDDHVADVAGTEQVWVAGRFADRFDLPYATGGSRLGAVQRAVTLGVRLVSVLNDDTQHVGQAAYVRGLLEL